MDDPQGDKLAIVDGCEMVGEVMKLVNSLELTAEERTNLVNIITDRIARLEKADQAFGYKSLATRTDFELKGIAKKYDNLVKGPLNDFKNEVKRLEDEKNQNMMLKEKNQKLSLQLEMRIPGTIFEMGDLGMGPTHTDAKEHGNERLQSRRHQHILQGSLLHGDYESEQEMEPLPAKKKRKKKIEENECTKVKKITNLIDSLGLSVHQLNRLKDRLCNRKQKRVEEKGYEFFSEEIAGSLKDISKSCSSLDDGLSCALIVVRELFDIEASENKKLKEQNQKLVWQLEILNHKTGNVVPDDGRNHNSESRGHLQVSRGGHGPTPPTSCVDYQGSQYSGTGTEGNNLPLTIAYDAPAPTPIMNPGVQQGSRLSAAPQVANTAFNATSSAQAVIPASEHHEGMLMSEGIHYSVGMPQPIGGHQQVHRGGLGATPANFFGVTPSSSNSTIRGNVGFHNMQRQQANFQDTGMTYNGETTTTNDQESFRNQIVKIDNKITNAFPFAKQVIEQNLKSNQQGSRYTGTGTEGDILPLTTACNAPAPTLVINPGVQQGSHSSAIRQGSNIAFDVSIYLNNDGDGHGSASTNSQMAVSGTNQTPNTFIGAPDSNTTNGQKDFINELEGGANAIVNESPIVKQQYEQIERQVNNHLLQDFELLDEVRYYELLSRLTSPDSEWNQETPVLERIRRRFEKDGVIHS